MKPKISSLQTRRISIAMACAAPMFFSFLSGCSTAEKEKEPVAEVQTTPAQRSPISQVVSAEAVVFPLEQATISPKITAPVVEFKVQRGSPVKKGQLLAVLENKDLTGQAEASKGNFEQADAGYLTAVEASIPQQVQKAELDAAAAKAAFDAQQKIYDSRKELFQQGAIPRRDLDAADVALAQARSVNEVAQKQLVDLKRLGKEQAIKSAHGSQLSARGQMDAAQAQLSYSEIKSPIDGVVTDRPLYVGDLAVANQPILTVMNTSRLIAKSHIPQSEAATLKVGNPAELKTATSDKPIKGRVTLVSPALDPGSTTIEVWVEAVKRDPALKPGMTVEVTMTAKTLKDALVVPASAVFKNDEGADYVLLAGPDDKAHQKPVQVGIRNAQSAQIVSGIIAGDPVITTGGYAVPDGTAIKIAKPGEDEKAVDEKGGKNEQAKDAAYDKKAAKDTAKDPAKDAKASGSAKPIKKEKE